MASFLVISVIAILASFQLPSEAKNATDHDALQTYIVQLQPPNHIAHLLNEKQKRESWYGSLLSQIVSHDHDDKTSSRLVYSYHHVFPGFAVRLTPDEFESLQHLEEVLSAWPDTMEYPHTTHYPEFMGLNRSAGGFWEQSDYGSGIIIGVLDTGINNDGHLSFKGAGSPPEEWKGKCEAPIRCNDKLIGAQSLVGESPQDFRGHGSHVAGIAAGYMVEGANVEGEGSGVASGIGPRSQLAVYKVCAADGCAGFAILAGFDRAISDGVHVISVSLGPRNGSAPLHRDTKAIGAFAAVKRGIFVSVSAGNSGPEASTVGNEAPWYLTVGASTTDRDMRRPDATSYGNPRAPAVAEFSSRGPTTVAKGIIKPDIIGPGVQIISASHNGSVNFVTKSGTSMSCPHLSGVAGLIKKLHPDWSPAAVKSAIITTSYQINGLDRPIEDDETKLAATPYDMGAGHVDVVKANDPGLVFDINPDDFIPYLCTDLGYSSTQVATIVSSTVFCETFEKVTYGSSLNLPSIWIDLRQAGSVTVPRTFTNVGSGASEVYKVEIEYNKPYKFLISVEPQELQFSDLKIEKTFQLTFTRNTSRQESGSVAASIVWRSDKHVVRSPIMVDI